MHLTEKSFSVSEILIGSVVWAAPVLRLGGLNRSESRAGHDPVHDQPVGRMTISTVFWVVPIWVGFGVCLPR